MEDIINFSEGTIIDNNIFFKEIWSKVYEMIFVKNRNYLVIDFSNVHLIMNNVLPKLCCLGIISKRHGVDIEINLDPSSRVKEFLGDLGFFEIVKRNEIFILNEGQIGGNNRPTKALNAFLCFDRLKLLEKYDGKVFDFSKQSTEKDKLYACIRAEIGGIQYAITRRLTSSMIMRSKVLIVLLEIICDVPMLDTYECEKFIDRFMWDSDRIDSEARIFLNLVSDFVEIIHNAIYHGKDKCFFSLTVGNYEKRYNNIKEKFKKVDYCVADTGKGLYYTLDRENWEKNNKIPITMSLNDFLSLKKEEDKNLYSIYEMLYFRAKDKDKGIYDIIINLAKRENVRIVIMNGNLCFQLWNKGINDILQNSKDKSVWKELKESIDYGFSIDITF